MKSRNVMALLVSSLAAAVAVNAQSVVPLPKEEPVVLSPFTVSTERDTGFVAASSLAGGRLATGLKDTPVAYSVITSDFIEALGLIDLEEAMAWQVGSYAPLTDTVNYKLFNNESGSAVMSRGVQASTQQRNFFMLGINSDAYSQERIDFARGPNALLIGTSGLGGQVIGMTKQARTDKAFTKVSMLIGSYERFRTTVDVNQPVGGKWAVRTNLLWQDSDTWRDLCFDNRRGAHFAVTYRPFRRTKLRAEYETYKQNTLVSRESLTDRLSGWDGLSTVPASISAITGSDAKGLARNGSSTTPYLVYIPGSDGGTVMNWANTWKTQGGAANAAVPVGGALALSTANLGISNGPIFENVYSLDSLFRLAETGSAFRRPSRAFVNLPNYPNRRYDFQVATVFLEHQQGEHFFFEAAYTHANTANVSEYIATRALGEVLIDVNQTLPNGQPNPNFKQPYGDAASADNHFEDRIDAYRAAVAAVFDRTRWGDFRASLMAGGSHNPSPTTRFTEAMDRSADVRARPRDDAFTYRYYWNDPVKPFTIPQQVNLVDPIAGTAKNYNVATVIDLTATNHRNAVTDYKYLQGTLTAKLLHGRLNLIAGARRDTLKLDSFTVNPSANANIADYPASWDGRTVHFRPLAPADYWRLTYQAKDAAGSITGNGAMLDALTRPRDSTGKPLPQYAKDRFRDDYSSPTIKADVSTVSYGGVFHLFKWVSAYYNFAETFVPPTSGLTLTGSTVPPGMSEGWDAGVRFSLLNGRVSASFGKYDSNQLYNSYDASGRVSKYRDIVAANKVGDLSTNGYNARGLPLIGSPVFDFRDRSARGKEIDIVANLTNNWRLTANAAFPEVLRTNEDQDQWAYLRANEVTLRQIVLDAGVSINASNIATVDTSVPVGSRSPDASAAATAWNDIQNFKTTSDPTGVVFTDLPNYTANVYTDYRFTRGFLKGLRAGGGVQYIGKRAIGNRGSDSIVNPTNPALAVDDPSVDADTRVYMSSYFTVTANFSYQYRLKRDLLLTLSLNIRNLLDNTDPIFTGTGLRPPGGDIRRPDRVTVPAGFIYRQPRSFEFATSLAF